MNKAYKQIKRSLIKGMCEKSFYFFCKKAFAVLEPQTKFESNWHIKYLCAVLQKEVERIARNEPKTKDLIINMPPRHMKSLICTVFLNAWAWTKYPWMKFLCASYSAELAEEHSQMTRDILLSDFYQKLWGGGWQLVESTKSKYSNTAKGKRASVGIKGGATGKGANILIVDDPMNPKEAYSNVERDNANRLYKTTLYNRVNNAAVGIRIIVMQRLNADDLTGNLMENHVGGYRQIVIPAVETADVKPSFLSKFYDGKTLWPSLFPKKVLDEYLANMLDDEYAGQYLQTPVLTTGRTWQPEWFQKWEGQLPSNVQGYVMSWDTAFKDKAKSDYSSCAVFLVLQNNKYILVEIYRDKLKFPDLKEVNKSLIQKYRPMSVLIEDKASGQSLIQELERDVDIYCPFEAITPNSSKLARASIVAPILKQGKVWYYSGDWYAEFLKEVRFFPNGKHDDQVDSCSQFFLWVTQFNNNAPQLR